MKEYTVIKGVRILNGDEKMRLAFGPVPELRLLKLYRY